MTTRRRYPQGASPAFCFAVEHTLEAEGYFSDHNWDPGGKTKFGITARVAQAHGHQVRSLSVPEAIRIYYLDYWSRPGLGRLQSWWVATECFDTQVNTGQGARIAQRALVYNHLATEADLRGGGTQWNDGRWGPLTRNALNRATQRYEHNLLGALNGEQYRHYHAIRPHKPELFERAIRGWLRRVWPELPAIDFRAWEAAARNGQPPASFATA